MLAVISVALCCLDSSGRLASICDDRFIVFEVLSTLQFISGNYRFWIFCWYLECAGSRRKSILLNTRFTLLICGCLLFANYAEVTFYLSLTPPPPHLTTFPLCLNREGKILPISYEVVPKVVKVYIILIRSWFFCLHHTQFSVSKKIATVSKNFSQVFRFVYFPFIV